jgi:hypothetical protein
MKFRRMLRHFRRLDITNSEGSVFMRRYYLLKLGWFNVYLHHILRSDEDMCLHDHPWRFATLILIGGYREVLPHGFRWRPPGTFLFRAAAFRHRVEVDCPAWSLVFVGRKFRPWGFFTRYGWRQWLPGQPRPICV